MMKTRRESEAGQQLKKVRDVMRRFVGLHPALYYGLLHFRGSETRGLAVSRETQLVIEGFLRSANTFAVLAFQGAQNGRLRIAHHLHVPAQVIRGAWLHIPIVVLVRDPIDAVLSLAIRESSVSLKQALSDYIWFYDAIARYRGACVIGSFDKVVKDYGSIINEINQKFDTYFACFEHTDSNVKDIFSNIEHINKQRGEISEAQIARPSVARKKLKNALRNALGEKSLEPLISKAENTYRVFRTQPRRERKDLLVSIVTPSYNQGQFIEDTILSVKNQDYPNIEHIIVDGGSTDNTLEILKKYEGAYNMRWISEPDKGQADAVNKGFTMAEGEIIGWLNSDDLLFHRGTISKVATAFSNGAANVVYGHAIVINAENKVMRVKIVPTFNYELLKRWCFLVQPGVFFQREVVKGNPLRTDLQYSMDYEYWLRLGIEYSWHHVGEIIAVDRNHAQRKILAQKDKSLDETIQLQREMGVKIGLWQHLIGKGYRGWLRIKGLPWMMSLYRKHNDFPNLIFDNPLALIKHQILGKQGRLL